MEIFIEKQLINIVYSVILGLIFGGIYDIIRIVHIFCGIASYSGGAVKMKHGIVPFGIFFLLDMAYMLTVTVIFSVFIFAVNNGGFRSYLLVSVIFGMIIYLLTVGRVVMLLSEMIVNFLRCVFELLVAKPVRFVVRLCGKCVGFLYSHTVGRIVRLLMRMSGYRYTEKMKHRLAYDIAFTDEKGKG